MQTNSVPAPKLVALKGNVPPSSIELEEAIAGAVLFDPNAVVRICDTLTPDHFYFTQYAEIYRSAIAVHRTGNPVDLMTIAMDLQTRGVFDKVGGQTGLVKAIDAVVSTANVDYYADVLVKKWKRRETIRVCREIASLAHDDSVSDDSLQNQTEEALLALFTESGKRSLRPLGEFVQEEVDRILTLADGESPAGISSGFYDLDEKIVGFMPAELTVIAGRPGSGKTAVAGAIARNIAEQGSPVAIFSLEMGGGQIAQRMLSSQSSIDSYKLRSGNLEEGDWGKIGESTEVLSKLPIWIDPSQSVSVTHIRSEIRRLVAEKGQIGAIVIDYLHLMLDGSDEEVREIGKMTRQLKLLSRELNTSIILLSQLSRAVEQRSDKRPVMSDLRSSGAIEQDADMIFMLYRDEYYNENSPDKGIAELNVVKNRNGSTGTVKLLFEPQFSRFRNLATKTTGYAPRQTPAQRKSAPAQSIEKVVPQKQQVPQKVEKEVPLTPTEVDGFAIGDRVEITLDNFSEEMKKTIRKEDDCSAIGKTGTVVSFDFWELTGAFDPVVKIDGLEKTLCKPSTYLRKVDDSDCDDF